MKPEENIIKIVLSFLFLGCLLDMPYGYYQLVRLLGMVGFVILAYSVYQKSRVWFVIWLTSAVLINPIFKISLGRELWNVVDMIWVIMLIGSIFINQSKTRTE